jgi:integrase
MGVHKRPGSRFYVYDFILDGVRYKASTERITKREAEAVEEAKRRDLLDRKQFGKLDEITLGEAVRRYVDRQRAEGARDIRMQESRARKLFGEELVGGEIVARKVTIRGREVIAGLDRNLPLHKLDTAEVERLVDIRLAEGLAPGTINNELALLQGTHTKARKSWKARVDATCEFQKLKTQAKLRFLSADEERRLLAEVDPTRERPGLAPFGKRLAEVQRQLQDIYDLTVFLLDTGCRYGEACSVKWEVVSLNQGTIHIYRHKVGNRGVLSMTERLRSVLTRRYGDRTSPYIFTGRHGRGMRITPDRAISGAMDRAGCNADELVAAAGRATAHTLRDTFASKLAQSGKVTLYELQHLLGHSSPAMTQKYAHLIPDQVATKAATVLDEIHQERAA